MIKIQSHPETRVRQGDIIRDVEFVESVSEKNGVVEVSRIVFPLVVVLTQDCDLEHDNNFRLETKRTQDKWLLSVLVAPLYNSEHVYRGEHLSELRMLMEPVPREKTAGQYLRSNERPRYHFLEFPPDARVVPSVIDFKHYFAVNGAYLRSIRKDNYVCTIGALFRESVSHRFASFLARIGLPE